MVKGCGPIGLIVSCECKNNIFIYTYTNITTVNLRILFSIEINTFGVVCVSGTVIFVMLLIEFFDVVGMLGVPGACISCVSMSVELISSLQCLSLRGADVSTRSTSDPEDSLSHSEHCLHYKTN